MTDLKKLREVRENVRRRRDVRGVSDAAVDWQEMRAFCDWLLREIDALLASASPGITKQEIAELEIASETCIDERERSTGADYDDLTTTIRCVESVIAKLRKMNND